MKVWGASPRKDFPQKLALKTGFVILPIRVQDMEGLILPHFRALLITCRLRQKTRYQKYWIKLVFNAGSFWDIPMGQQSRPAMVRAFLINAFVA